MTGLLASVRDAREARLALAGGADLIDLKEPAAGALGAVLPEVVREVVALVALVAPARGTSPVRVSATIGDLPLQPARVEPAVRAVAACGVDFVKIGFFAGDAAACLRALAPLAHETGLIAVLFADRAPDFALLPHLGRAGFRGAMLDTADKRGSLRAHLADRDLARFVAATHALGMLAGLAGSLRVEDVRPLAALAPDYLGFRGALCGAGGRSAGLDAAALAGVRAALGVRAAACGCARETPCASRRLNPAAV